MSFSDLAKYSMTGSTVQPLCDSWASCYSKHDMYMMTTTTTIIIIIMIIIIMAMIIQQLIRCCYMATTWLQRCQYIHNTILNILWHIKFFQFLLLCSQMLQVSNSSTKH